MSLLTPWFSFETKPQRAGTYEVAISGISGNKDALMVGQLRAVGWAQRRDTEILVLVGYAHYSPATSTWTINDTDLVMRIEDPARVWWRGLTMPVLEAPL